jgi:branched-chain amino acid transport system ATP-binding protein
MTAPFLELDRISAGYHGRPVLNGVSLGVSAGSVTVIIGPNGHGKTTLMRTISGLLPLFAGSIRFEGVALDGLSVERIVERGVVHIPQGDLLFPEMTVLENLQMGAYLPDAGKEAARRLEQVFEVLPRLGERRGQTASTLSGGERRMLALGRGLMTGGRILLIDEPSLGLAPILIDQVYQVLAQLKEEGRTILLVEESASRAASIADRIHLLDNGRIIWEGPPAELEQREELIETYLGG